MNIKTKLNRMKGHLQLDKGLKETKFSNQQQAPEVEETVADDELTLKWSQLGFKPYVYEDQLSYEKRYTVPFDRMGKTNLQKELFEVKELWKKSDLDHPLSSKEVPLNRMLFFDTETTGLSSGAGNSIFLIGYARIVEEGVEITQHILKDPSSEAAFLYRFLLDFQEDDYLVSYNGKAFDWPQVKTRHTFVRNQVPRLPSFGHIDLLHAARRLWKHELPSCRLSIVEKEKLGINRGLDTPGSMAPILYFDYIHDKDPNHLKGIIEHNDQDVRSLVSLYVILTKRLFFSEGVKMSTMEHVQIGNWFEQTKAINMAKDHYIKAIDNGGNGREEAYFKLAVLEKKDNNVMVAKELFLKCISVGTLPKIEAMIELAKIAEHHEKDLEAAYEISRKAMGNLKKSARLTASSKRIVQDVEKRLLRLEKKMMK
ncbi:uncharacterized protein YprB with RNaseH-like and TPR domain [Evansella vedderi]|uniref:Uncharacterized protein YprB with RNaseH-like and TPR domain n=1 Tax=Evansella vedderi TaxID=38282 RepID=A0ABT9ZX02_9BACI|nr:ribonuclease H-like domain-containing protein [Evansella vedderi]MDQ0255766.1 uncharacterized protein YprB with RNaseH-like and TPR domain [Evansella vedderi]